MALHEANGAWPAGLSAEAPQFPELPRDASWPDAARHYGTVTAHLAATLPKIVQALEFLRDAGHQMAFSIASLQRAPSIPPSRPESASYHDAVAQAKQETEERVREEARRTPGPLVDPDAAARIAADVFAQKMAEREAEILARANADRLAAIDAAEEKATRDREDLERQRRSDRRDIRLKFWGALVAAIAAGIVATVTTAATYEAKAVRERALGRAEGMHEAPQAPAAPPLPPPHP
jgi:hypothetical protein